MRLAPSNAVATNYYSRSGRVVINAIGWAITIIARGPQRRCGRCNDTTDDTAGNRAAPAPSVMPAPRRRGGWCGTAHRGERGNGDRGSTCQQLCFHVLLLYQLDFWDRGQSIDRTAKN